MADIDTALGQEILDVAQRQWVSDVHHHDQTDDLWRAVEISERVAHASMLTRPHAGPEFALTEPDAGPGMNLLQDLRHSPAPGTLRPIGVRSDGGKLERMAAQTAKIEAGHMHVPENARWLPEFLAELLAFPHGRHDDQVDSVSQFLLVAAREFPPQRAHRRAYSLLSAKDVSPC